ncbi:MAG: hypothetical protein ACYTEQ_28035 [Planctomycetota bacterium]
MGYAARSSKASRNGRPVVLDFDDLCDTNDDMDTLKRLKERDPGFKVTLFAIPTRCGDELLSRYDQESEWIQLGIHGWRHARHECLAWTSEETVEKLGLARHIYPKFAPVFKAPNWEICDEVYAGCKESGFAVADHIRNIVIMPADMPHYVYNLRLRNDKYQRLHGHIQPFMNTGLAEAYDSTWAKIKVGTPYLFISDVIVSEKEIAA